MASTKQLEKSIAEIKKKIKELEEVLSTADKSFLENQLQPGTFYKLIDNGTGLLENTFVVIDVDGMFYSLNLDNYSVTSLLEIPVEVVERD